MTDYNKEVKEAWNRWENEPETKPKRKIPFCICEEVIDNNTIVVIESEIEL